MKKQIVLISGKQGSGKTTTTEGLIRRIHSKPGWYVKEFRFADAIYQIHNFARGLLRDLGIDRPEKDGKLLQLLGTEWGRDTIDPDIWVKCCKGAIEKWVKEISVPAYNPERVIAIVSDCRFRNEFEGFPEALRVRLNCPEEIRKERCPSWRDTTNHPSETDLDYHSNMFMFDAYFKTNEVDANGCTELTLHKLMAENWIEKRG